MIVSDQKCRFYFNLSGLKDPKTNLWDALSNDLRRALKEYAVDPILLEAKKNWQLQQLANAKSDSNKSQVNQFQNGADNCIKEWFRDYIILIAIFAAVLGTSGIIGNVYMMFILLRKGNFQVKIRLMFLYLCAIDILRCLVVLPLTVTLMLNRFWYLGRMLCNATPLLQQYLLIVSAATYLAISVERYTFEFYKSWYDRLSPRVTNIAFVGGSLFLACFCFPVLKYVRYLDFGLYIDTNLRGQGLCLCGFGEDAIEYHCTSFVLLFMVPLVAMAYFLTATSKELGNRRKAEQMKLKNRRLSQASQAKAFRTTDFESSKGQNSAEYSEREIDVTTCGPTRQSTYDLTDRHDSPCASGRQSAPPKIGQLLIASPNDSLQQPRSSRASSGTFLHEIDDTTVDYHTQQKAVHCIAVMAAIFAVCWSPIQLLNLFTEVTEESSRNIKKMESLVLVFLMIAFCSVTVNPMILLHQQKLLVVPLQESINFMYRCSSPLSKTIRSLPMSARRESQRLASPTPRIEVQLSSRHASAAEIESDV